MIHIPPKLLLLLGAFLPFTAGFPIVNRQMNFTALQTAASGAYQQFLQSKGVSVTTFSPLAPERDVPSAAGNDTNQAIFSAVDLLPGNVSFSGQYQVFVMMAAVLVPRPTQTQQDQLDALSKKQVATCHGAAAMNATNGTFHAYLDGGGTGNRTSPEFYQFRDTYGPYQAFERACNASMAAFLQAEHDRIGIVGDAVQKASARTQDLTPSEIPSLAPPGNYTMPISNGTLLPFYSLPSLDATLSGWGTDANVSISGTATNSEVGQTFTANISFGGIQLLDVQRGAWFDNFDSAHAAASPESNVSNAAAYQSTFTKYFGTAQNPGPVAKYTDKVIVVYKPKAVLTFTSLAEANMYALMPPSGGMWGTGALSDTDPEFIYEPKT
ncbi:hypothetical protein C8R46DRAFT_1184187, partial [Mycena filopes]